MDYFDEIARQRRAIADLGDTLSTDQWSSPSLCGEWSVHDVAAHLVMALTTPIRRVLVEMARARGDFHRANVALTTATAAASSAELLRLLRANAESHFTPPGLDSRSQLADNYLHAQDMFVPLGLSAPGELASWPVILDFLVSPKARRGFVGRELPDVTWTASDVAWFHGRGAEVRGPASALGIAICGRRARLDELSGEGASLVRSWVEVRA